MEKRNRYTPEFKTKVVPGVPQEEHTANEIAAKYGISPVMISQWKAEFLSRALMVFEKGINEVDKLRKEYESKQERLEKLVGQLTVEVDWLKKNLVPNEPLQVRKAIVKRQAELLTVNRTSVYRPVSANQPSDENIQLMHQIDVIYMKHPYYGYRRMTRTLQNQGWIVNRKRIRRLMKLMGLEAIYPKPNLSKRLNTTYYRPNQVWGVDITYVRMGKGFMYLFTIIDWYSRKVIDYELSSTLEKSFVLACLKRAFHRCKLEIMPVEVPCQVAVGNLHYSIYKDRGA